jgi:hypothetical protein
VEVLVGGLWGVLLSVPLLVVVTQGSLASSIASFIGVLFLHFFLPVMGFAWLATIGIVLLIKLVSSRNGRLLFYDGKIRGGAKGALWREAEFPLSELDRPRSCSRRLYQRLLGYQVLHSVNGAKIHWERAAFSKEAVAQALDRLRCD